MGSNIIELAKLGHERAAELKASCGAVDVRSLAQLISDLATQLEVQLVRGNEQAVQLANAESKCRELAAENAALKVANAEGCKWDGEQWVGISIETPATDAFLAEVRAQGVEILADELLCPDIDDSIREFAAKLRKGAAL